MTPSDNRKKHILLISTGGTIASSVSEEGLAPTLASDHLLSCQHRIAVPLRQHQHEACLLASYRALYP